MILGVAQQGHELRALLNSSMNFKRALRSAKARRSQFIL